MQQLREMLPREIIYKADKVITDAGESLYAYRGGNWMKRIDYQDSTYQDRLIEYFEGSPPENVTLMIPVNHLLPQLLSFVNSLPGSTVYTVDEWKDTALFMQRIG